MWTVVKKHTKAFLVLLLLSGPVLSGCQSTETFYRGYKADNEGLVMLSTPAGQKTWKTFDLTLSYQYEQSEGILDIHGSALFSLYYELNVGYISNLDLYLFFLDKNALVLETTQLAKVIYSRPEDEVSFRKRLPVPDGATSFTFGYRGMAYGDGGGMSTGDGGGGGGSKLFYELPKRPKN